MHSLRFITDLAATSLWKIRLWNFSNSRPKFLTWQKSKRSSESLIVQSVNLVHLKWQLIWQEFVPILKLQGDQFGAKIVLNPYSVCPAQHFMGSVWFSVTTVCYRYATMASIESHKQKSPNYYGEVLLRLNSKWSRWQPRDGGQQTVKNNCYRSPLFCSS